MRGTFKCMLDSGATSSMMGSEMAEVWQATMLRILGKIVCSWIQGAPITKSRFDPMVCRWPGVRFPGLHR
eukprot:553545-Pyramimonas_sp.AAC.1